MICCKIVTNFNAGDIEKLFNSLSSAGEFLLANNYLYFCDTESNITETKIKNFLKKAGYTNFFIDIYNKDNQPCESEEINGWLLNKIMKMNYNLCEQENQKLFQEISKGLDLLDIELDNIAKNALKKKKKQ